MSYEFTVLGNIKDLNSETIRNYIGWWGVLIQTSDSTMTAIRGTVCKVGDDDNLNYRKNNDERIGLKSGDVYIDNTTFHNNYPLVYDSEVYTFSDETGTYIFKVRKQC